MIAIILNIRIRSPLAAKKPQFAWDADQVPTEPGARNILGRMPFLAVCARVLIFKENIEMFPGKPVSGRGRNSLSFALQQRAIRHASRR